MTLQKDEPKQPQTLLSKIVWIVTITVAAGCIIAAIVIGIANHVNIF